MIRPELLDCASPAVKALYAQIEGLMKIISSYEEFIVFLQTHIKRQDDRIKELEAQIESANMVLPRTEAERQETAE